MAYGELLQSQKSILKQYVIDHPDVTGIDDVPYDVYSEAESKKESEYFHTSANNYIQEVSDEIATSKWGEAKHISHGENRKGGYKRFYAAEKEGWECPLCHVILGDGDVEPYDHIKIHSAATEEGSLLNGRCPQCDGTGFDMLSESPCPRCDGTGELKDGLPKATEGLYEDYISTFGDSSSLGGGFGDALQNGDLCEAWTRADLENRERLKKITGRTEEDLNDSCYDNKPNYFGDESKAIERDPDSYSAGYLQAGRRRLLKQAEEDDQCPVCGEKAPYDNSYRLDYWETHFTDKHRLNESKATEGGWCNKCQRDTGQGWSYSNKTSHMKRVHPEVPRSEWNSLDYWGSDVSGADNYIGDDAARDNYAVKQWEDSEAVEVRELSPNTKWRVEIQDNSRDSGTNVYNWEMGSQATEEDIKEKLYGTYTDAGFQYTRDDVNDWSTKITKVGEEELGDAHTELARDTMRDEKRILDNEEETDLEKSRTRGFPYQEGGEGFYPYGISRGYLDAKCKTCGDEFDSEEQMTDHYKRFTDHESNLGEPEGIPNSESLATEWNKKSPYFSQNAWTPEDEQDYRDEQNFDPPFPEEEEANEDLTPKDIEDYYASQDKDVGEDDQELLDFYASMSQEGHPKIADDDEIINWINTKPSDINLDTSEMMDRYDITRDEAFRLIDKANSIKYGEEVDFSTKHLGSSPNADSTDDEILNWINNDHLTGEPSDQFEDDVGSGRSIVNSLFDRHSLDHMINESKAGELITEDDWMNPDFPEQQSTDKQKSMYKQSGMPLQRDGEPDVDNFEENERWYEELSSINDYTTNGVNLWDHDTLEPVEYDDSIRDDLSYGRSPNYESKATESICPECKGTGFIDISDSNFASVGEKICPECDGEGTIEDSPPLSEWDEKKYGPHGETKAGEYEVDIQDGVAEEDLEDNAGLNTSDNQAGNVFNCPSCGFKTHNRDEYDAHNNTHGNVPATVDTPLSEENIAVQNNDYQLLSRFKQ